LTVRPSYADVSRISGDTLAADYLESTLDGTGGTTWKMGRLDIDGANGANPSLFIRNTSGTAASIITTAASAGTYGLTISASGAAGQYALVLDGQTDDMFGQINLDANLKGSYDAADFETAFYDTVTATTRIRADSLFTQAASILAMIDAGNELVSLDTLKWVIGMLDTVIDSLTTQAWWSTSDCAGVGAYTCSLYVKDTLNDLRVPFVNVSVNNQAEDATPRVVTTDENGLAVVQYSNGDYRAMRTDLL
jgi:hypothetical protein